MKNYNADLFYNKSIIEDIEIIIAKRSREIFSNKDMSFSDYFILFKSFLARSNFYPDDGFVEALEEMYMVSTGNLIAKFLRAEMITEQEAMEYSIPSENSKEPG